MAAKRNSRQRNGRRRNGERAGIGENGGRPMQRAAQDSAQSMDRAGRDIAGLSSQALAVWTEVGQDVVRDLMTLSSSTVQESTRRMVEMQQASMDTLREMQFGAFRWQTLWPEMFRDPIRWYQGSTQDLIDTTQKWWGLARRNAETVRQSYQRMEQTTSQATRELERTFSQAKSKMQGIPIRQEQRRAA
jgi:hypothetical protein